MATLTDLYPSYYNVLANPTVIPSNASSFGDYKGAITSIWEDFSKTGLKEPMVTNLKSIFETFQTDSINYQAIAQSTIGLILSATPLAPVAPFVNMFIGFIWPFLFGAKDAPSLFDQILAAVRLEMQQAFQQFTLNNLTETINGMQTALSNFNEQTLVAIGQGSRPGLLIVDANCEPCQSGENPPCIPCPSDLDRVRTLFETARAQIEGGLPHFRDPLANVISNPTPDWNQNYITMCLPLYTIVATMNLLLYQGYIQFAETWKFAADGSISSGYSQANIDSLKATLRKRIVSYTNDLYSTFNKYLPIQDTDSIPYTKGKLNDYIRYMRVMTTQCFDIASLWPMMDPHDYPISTTRTLTRLMFNDVIGPVEGTHQDANTKYSDRDDTKLTLSMKTLDGSSINLGIKSLVYTPFRLKSLQFQTYKKDWHCYVNGYKSVYTGLNGDVSFKTANGGVNTSIGKDFFTDFPLLNRLNMGSYAVGKNSHDDTAIFMDVSGGGGFPSETPNEYGGCPSGGCCIDTDPRRDRSHNDINYDDHHIQSIYEVTATNSNIYSYYYNTDKTGYIPTLLPVDTPMYPSIGTGDNPKNTIYTIPGELFTNGNGINSLPEFINGTSGSLVIRPGAIVDYHFLNQTANKYQIRVRVATNQDSGSLQITIGDTTKTINIPNTTTAATDQKGLKGKNGTYMVFPEIISSSSDVSFDINQGNQIMTVKNNSNVPIILVDRFEFIPPSLVFSKIIDTIPVSMLKTGDDNHIWKTPSNAFGMQVKLNIVVKDSTGTDITEGNFQINYFNDPNEDLYSVDFHSCRSGEYLYRPTKDTFKYIRLTQVGVREDVLPSWDGKDLQVTFSGEIYGIA
ncbi:insecticidal delta-endotoxin Cry8Ea1 family protein (plasmid) [Bacillus cereus]|uniref:insecticidal delta-endotoxin Cry8Ea1 family protein n=1 Tax=Bacillus cereus TaxID=1396 RepID=UPI001F2BDB49|nr:insecticidal delta-endotoxin Cry8Ea1 family protein [Bacillus cereus]UIJ70215.1 insecticidal delta-endotoxin Cry8Ea1 family protein [Bacillus cereus]